VSCVKIKVSGNEKVKNRFRVFAHIFIKNGSIYVKPKKILTEYISPADMLRFCDNL